MNEIDHIITPNGTRHEIVDAAARELLGSRPTFAGLEIAPGPLFFDGVEFGQYPDWNHNSYNDKYGKVAGSTYFNFIELGKRFDSRGEAFSASSGDIDNARPLDGGWRVPTKAEWEKILAIELPAAQRRPGAMFDNEPGAYWAPISAGGYGNKDGLLVFPDSIVLDTIPLASVNDIEAPTVLTAEQLANAFSLGCVFLPAFGSFGEGWGGNNEYGDYYSSSSSGGEDNIALEMFFAHDEITSALTTDKLESYLPVRLVREARSVVESLEEIAGQFYGYETLLNAI